MNAKSVLLISGFLCFAITNCALAADTATVVGVISRRDGAPLSKSVLVLRRLFSSKTTLVKADRNGKFRIKVQPGYYQLGVEYRYSYSGLSSAYQAGKCDFNANESCAGQLGCYPIVAKDKSYNEIPRDYSINNDSGFDAVVTEANQFFYFGGRKTRKLNLSYGLRCI